jgi:hypothetical protein
MVGRMTQKQHSTPRARAHPQAHPVARAEVIIIELSFKRRSDCRCLTSAALK